GGLLPVIAAVRQRRGQAGPRPRARADLALVSGHGLGMNSHTSLVLGR
ncbi:MAG: hypothetical protein IT508_10605, partial [Burkholderiaceae bacterium]|nr:hypothetical protein [Burkholderiaceae bacterium]